MQKYALIAAAFLSVSATCANAQPAATATPSQAPGYQVTLASCQAYEARMRRTAMMNKVLSANYNAERVLNECLANPSLASR